MDRVAPAPRLGLVGAGAVEGPPVPAGVGLAPALHPASKTAMARLDSTRPPILRLDIPIPPAERNRTVRFRQWLGVVPAAKGVGHASKPAVLSGDSPTRVNRQLTPRHYRVKLAPDRDRGRRQRHAPVVVPRRRGDAGQAVTMKPS